MMYSSRAFMPAKKASSSSEPKAKDSQKRVKIVAIDDQVLILRILDEILTRHCYDIKTCESGEQGLELCEVFKPDIVLCDLHMPGMDGFEVISTMHERWPNLPVIIVSAQNDIKDVTRAIRLGARDYITKPIYDFDLLIHTINSTLEKSRLNRENEEYRESLELMVEQRTQELHQLNQQLQDVVFSAVSSFAILTEKRDPYTAGHQERVAKLATLFAETLGYDSEDIDGIRVAGLLHDIGKIYVPSEFLTKPSRLENIEFEIIKKHANVGYEILRSIPFPWPVADMVHQHHERLDGSGYPQGLRGDEILPGSQLLSIADSFEAMVSHRPYRPGLGAQFAMTELKSEEGFHYCQPGIEVLMHLLDSKNDQLGQIIPVIQSH